jgi:hypothetical protein
LNRTVESHIIILLGVASRHVKVPITINEKLLYMVFFLMTDDNKKLRTKVYHFRKGITLPESDTLKHSLRSPSYYKECWEIRETGISLTAKGIDKFRYLMRHEKEILEGFTKLLNELGTFSIFTNELEIFIQLKYPNWVTKWVDAIDTAMKRNPQMTREDVLKQLQSSDFINDTVKRAVFASAVENRNRLIDGIRKRGVISDEQSI